MDQIDTEWIKMVLEQKYTVTDEGIDEAIHFLGQTIFHPITSYEVVNAFELIKYRKSNINNIQFQNTHLNHLFRTFESLFLEGHEDACCVMVGAFTEHLLQEECLRNCSTEGGSPTQRRVLNAIQLYRRNPGINQMIKALEGILDQSDINDINKIRKMRDSIIHHNGLIFISIDDIKTMGAFLFEEERTNALESLQAIYRILTRLGTLPNSGVTFVMAK